MLPAFLIPESLIREDGSGPTVPVGSAQGRLLLLTLGITRVIEQESLEVSLWASPDGENWGSKPVLTVPQKFYCGVYRYLLDLAERPEVRYLQARWKVNRWGRGDPRPLFGVWMAVEQSEAQALRAGSG